MARFSLRGLTPQLFLIVILPLTVLLVIVTFGSLYLHRQAMRNLVGERDERAARAAANALREQFNHRSAAIHGLALRAGPGSSSQALDRILRESDFLLKDFDGGMAFLTSEGEVIASIGDERLWENFRLESQGELQSLLKKGSPTSFLIFNDPISGDSLMLSAYRVPESDLLAAGAFEPAVLARNVLSDVFSPGAGAVAFVVDQRRQVVYEMGSSSGATDLANHPGVAEALAGESGATYLPVGGAERVIAFSPVSPVRWALVIEEPWEAVAGPLLTATENVPLLLIPILVLAIVALWFGTSRIVQPLQRLESEAAELAWGNYEAIQESVGGIAEIRRLQTELIHLAQKVKTAQQGLRGYIGAITMGQEEERRRLARELHDDTLQSLIALNQRVQLARMSPDDGGKGGESWGEIQELTEETIQNLRRLTRALRPIYLEDLGLVTALEMLAREVEQASEVSIDFEKRGQQSRLQPTEELALYRIAQEALSNMARHAQATQARITVRFTDFSVMVEIRDNGAGFDLPDSPAEFAPGGHFGLLGMYERSELIGARLEIDSTPGEGTHIKIELPLNDAPGD
jgi:two-component system sensor histidine kinase UhpB